MYLKLNKKALTYAPTPRPLSHPAHATGKKKKGIVRRMQGCHTQAPQPQGGVRIFIYLFKTQYLIINNRNTFA
jgi:hypothetical protein